MAHGGKRPGAGRKPGSLTKRTQEILAAAANDGVTPLEFMLQVLRDPGKTFEDRFKAAVNAAPYMHPKLQSVEHSGDADNPVGIAITSAVPRADDADDDDQRHPAQSH